MLNESKAEGVALGSPEGARSATGGEPSAAAEVKRWSAGRKKEVVLLGLFYTVDGEKYQPAFTKKPNGKRYRYYVPNRKVRFGADASPAGRVPAEPIGQMVLAQIHAALMSPEMVQSVWDGTPWPARCGRARLAVNYWKWNSRRWWHDKDHPDGRGHASMWSAGRKTYDLHPGAHQAPRRAQGGNTRPSRKPRQCWRGGQEKTQPARVGF